MTFEPKKWRYAREYRHSLRPPVETRHAWVVRGQVMCLELWITEPGPALGIEPQAGLESHYLIRPPWVQDEAPHHTSCSITGGDCWHDGTSLYAMEYYLPMWRPCRDPADQFWDDLEYDLKRYEADLGTDTDQEIS